MHKVPRLFRYLSQPLVGAVVDESGDVSVNNLHETFALDTQTVLWGT